MENKDLSNDALHYLNCVSESYQNKKIVIPSWDQMFLQIAFMVARRSKDAQTKHGCVLIKNNRIIATGYNSFPENMPDELLPNLRPEKYDWMLHSERNALSNTVESPSGATAYVTGQPCNDCAMAMYQSGIRKFVLAKRKGWEKENEKTKIIFEILTKYGNIDVRYIDVETNVLEEAIDEIDKIRS